MMHTFHTLDSGFRGGFSVSGTVRHPRVALLFLVLKKELYEKKKRSPSS